MFWMDRQTDERMYLQDRHSEVPNGKLPLQIHEVNPRNLNPQALF